MMAERLRVVALISGGKDSFFSILHCIKNDHDVVALANLFPPQDDDSAAVDDLDSFMYQTVGHAIIPLYSQALELPLYRQEIIGGANNQHKSYGPPANEQSTCPDETESLVPLLRRVMKAQPEVNAVCTGAILSDYQRTRVESVALRLGLVPLSYLWQFTSLPPQIETSLLQDMAAVGQDSRIIKVASGGLDQSHLWKNVADPKTIARLSAAAARFGTSGDGAVLGEGGEFETLAICGPPPVWKKRIVIDEMDRECLDGDAGTASIRLGNPRLEPLLPFDNENPRPRVPPLFDDGFEEILQRMSVGNDSDTSLSSLIPAFVFNNDRSLNSDILFIPNITAEGSDAVAQIAAIMDKLSEQLNQRGHCLDDIVYTTIIVRDMADFASVNAVYSRSFSEPNPPARVTIACRQVLSPSSLLAVAASSRRRDPRTIKKGLHVQSRSYWAPANIGPYSQAISVPSAPITNGEAQSEVIYIAGQIPLVPATMQVVNGTESSFVETFVKQAVLSLQHLFRIATRVDVDRFAGVVAFIAIQDEEHIITASNICRQVWIAAHRLMQSRENDDVDDQEADVDIWDLQNRSRFGQPQSKQSTTAKGVGASGEIPPMKVVRVDALPRGVQIEWAAFGLSQCGRPDPAIPHLCYLLDTFSDLTID